MRLLLHATLFVALGFFISLAFYLAWVTARISL